MYNRTLKYEEDEEGGEGGGAGRERVEKTTSGKKKRKRPTKMTPKSRVTTPTTLFKVTFGIKRKF